MGKQKKESDGDGEHLNSAPSSSSPDLSCATASSSSNALLLYDEHSMCRRPPSKAPLKPPTSPPRSTFMSSMFGRQVLSQRVTGPTICFGTAERATQEKQYYSQEMDKARAGLEGPGPVYEVKVTSLGKQVASQKESFPEVGFALSNRFSMKRYGDGNPGPGAYSSTSAFGPQVLSYQKSPSSADFSRSTRDEQNKIYLSAEFNKNKYGVGSPGPTVCDDSSSMGNQVVAPFKSAPRVRFGAEKRFKHMDDGCSPGVGKYETLSSFGKQNESKKKNLPSFSFCHSNRDQRAKVFISAQHDKAHYGEGSPGPAAALKAYRSLVTSFPTIKVSLEDCQEEEG